MTTSRQGYLFEVSWEICNKVGGIYTVIQSKLLEATRAYGDRCILLGPDIKTNLEFEETDEHFWAKIREGTAIKEIPCRFGRWKVPGEPKAILVGYGKKYNKDQLLYRIWEDFGVDSIAGGWDYIEPVMFSYACGEVIETVYNCMAKPFGLPTIAQFHEWMTGAGLLYLKKNVPAIGTIFTTHATILGRSLAGSGVDIYSNMERISPQREASAHNVTAKYSMEAVTAREADCFTTVSDITAMEAKNFLGRQPDFITPNGLEMEHIPDFTDNRTPALNSKKKLLDAAGRFLRKDFSLNTKIFSISGRYEFHNKGIDVFLSALGRLDKEISESVIAYFFVLGGYTDLIPALQGEYGKTDQGTPPPISTHRLHYEASDPILQTCNRIGLNNAAKNKVHVIFIPAYLNGHDGLLNMTYYEALSGCDLGVFPSFYEPWGYTPQESAAFAVPTVTTDQAGFGLWVERSEGENTGVVLIRRRGQDMPTIEETLYQVLKDALSWSDMDMHKRRKKARSIAVKATWTNFFKQYLKAYDKAEQCARDRSDQLTSEEYKAEKKYTYTSVVSMQPHFRSFTAIADLPKNVSRLRELAYNLWWSWNPRSLDVFATIQPRLWPEIGNNPVKMLEEIASERLAASAGNASYVNLYARVMKEFDEYMEDKTSTERLQKCDDIRWSSPIAYFSTEYGVHESIPIYSGGLGVLSGDHLKTASDLNIPMVGIGLLYKYGFFKQVIDKNGVQVTQYAENDFSTMPITIVQDDRGNEIQISIELPGRTLYANIWQIKIGRVSLYLMDTDIPRNTIQDRKITANLYVADQKTRIEQEILLGIGGIRLLRRLGIEPSVYHINEGHSAFLIFERISHLMTEQGLSFDEAGEVVRGSTIFTTHTPVEAGNERFSKDLMEHYFSNFVKWSGISWSQFWELGKKESGEDKPFFMTILALKLSHMSNAVSRIHGQISKSIWRNVWKGLHYSEIPIRNITNGVHMMSYVAPRMKDLLNAFLEAGWDKEITSKERWSRIENMSDDLLWRTRYELKQKAINVIRDQTVKQWAKYGYAKTWSDDIFSKINPSALLIGFSRRFAPYKRADLLFFDLKRLDKILNNPSRPVHIVFAGKAHPNDEMGKNIIKKVIDISKEERFRGKIFFLEDYDIHIARQLIQGVDVWMNTPRRPYEACGTSGQKVAINGVLNFSVSDGWWSEGYDGTNGWTIGPVAKDYMDESPTADEEDSQSLYTTLENTIIPLFYNRDETGLPGTWLSMVKRSMQTLIPCFNSERMLLEYYNDMYAPTAKRHCELTKDSFGLVKEIADWKLKIPMRFSSLKFLNVIVEGIHGDNIFVDQPLIVNVRIDPGKLDPGEILVELVIGKVEGTSFTGDLESVPLQIIDTSEEGILTFTVKYKVKHNGSYNYGIRVFPYNKKLSYKYETGLILWG
ncbi:MAG: alpha-glucan family phosphorylase [Deltaproteobacteria bacterium]|nr:alpha-glucan family phosphorylase [Deltaproteobacteria bacterium]